MVTIIRFLGNVIFKLMFLTIKVNYFKIKLENKLNYIKTKWLYILSDFNIKNIRMRLKVYKPVDDLKTKIENDQKWREQDNKVFKELMNRAFKDNL